jgi:peptide/nickel transport system permease protein
MSSLTLGPRVRSRVGTRRSSRGRGPLQGLRTGRGATGLAIVALVLLAGLIVPLFLKYGALDQSGETLVGAGVGGHLFGTDEVGRDILARTLQGVRVDALLAVISVPVAAVLGTALGLASALSRRGGAAAQYLFNFLLGFPGVVMGIAVSIAIAPGVTAICVAIVLVTIPTFGRQARLTALGEMSRDYVSAATVVGRSRRAILVSHILPNVADSVIVRLAPAVSAVIQIEGALSVVGLGIQPPQASLGEMIATGSQYLSNAPLYALAPLGVVFVLVLGLSLVAGALNRAMLRR